MTLVWRKTMCKLPWIYFTMLSYFFLCLMQSQPIRVKWSRQTLVPHTSHCSLYLVKLSFTAFVAPTSHFLHRSLISPSNGYLFPIPPGGRSSWSDLSKAFSSLCINAVPNPFIWRFSMKVFVSWLERFHGNLKVFAFFTSSKFFRHQNVLVLTLTVSIM